MILWNMLQIMLHCLSEEQIRLFIFWSCIGVVWLYLLGELECLSIAVFLVGGLANTGPTQETEVDIRVLWLINMESWTPKNLPVFGNEQNGKQATGARLQTETAAWTREVKGGGDRQEMRGKWEPEEGSESRVRDRFQRVPGYSYCQENQEKKSYDFYTENCPHRYNQKQCSSTTDPERGSLDLPIPHFSSGWLTLETDWNIISTVSV